jgi:hypothetical protein
MKQELEIWKPIEEVDGHYQVSNFGRVKRMSRKINSSIQKCGYRVSKEKMVRACDNGNGYLSVMPQIKGKRVVMYVHRLVAMYFLPNPKNHDEVNHIDFNKSNNHHSNLEWCSRRQNYTHFISDTSRPVRAVSGFVGVKRQDSISEAYCYTVCCNSNTFRAGGFKTKEDAARARDLLILEKGFPNRLNFREEKTTI